MYTIKDIKKAQQALEEAKARPVESFPAAEESFFNNAPATREEAKAELVASKERLLQAAFNCAAEQKERDRYIAKHGLEATVI